MFNPRFHKNPFGGGGGSRTPVQESFTLKGLQQFINHHQETCRASP